MSNPEAVAWLRSQIEGDKAAAEAAHRAGEGHWWRCTTSDVHGTNRPVGALYGGQPAYDADGEVFGGTTIVVYDEGRPTDEQFAHIALHDPQDVIADCEAKLAILDECDLLLKVGIAYPDEAGPESATRIVRLMAQGYRHRDGYTQHWGSGD